MRNAVHTRPGATDPGGGAYIDLNALVARAHELEPLGSSAMRLSQLVASPDPDLREIVRVVELDQALTGRVLRLANSAAMGGMREIGTVKDAVIRVGTGAVLSLAVADEAKESLSIDIPTFDLTGEVQWNHSVGTALAAEVLRAAVNVSVPPEAFTAALCHDIGKLVMGAFLTREDQAFIARAQHEGGLTHLQAESELLGVHHAELGGLIARHWQLPESVVRAITFHHTPDDSPEPISDLVAVANLVAKRCDLGPFPQDVHPDDLSGALQRLGLGEPQLERAKTKVEERFREVQSLYG